MGKPKAPNPNAVAASQTASNQQTAITQAGLNMVDQTDAYGNKLSYSQNGAWSDGTPRFSATQTLSGPQQQLLNTGQQTQQNLANLAQEQSGRLSGLLSEPLDWSAQQGFLNDLTEQNLNPQWDRMAQQNETNLINRGIRPGSAQYTQAQDDFARSRSSAFNDARLNNYNSSLQSQLALRAQPLNEILALSGQAGVQQPSFTSTPQTGVAGTDVAGLTNSMYQSQLQGYNSMMGGLFSAGAGLLAAPQTSVLGGLLSDRRAKTNIVKIGQTDSGVNVYRFTYKHSGQTTIGYMAQELLETHPESVSVGPDGLYRVDYAKVS